MAKYYRFNLKGDLLVEKNFDEVAYPFGGNNEFLQVRKGKKWGVALNESLELVIPIQYDRIEAWLFAKSQRLMVWNGDDFSIIGINNNILIPPGYTFINFDNNNQDLGRAGLNGKVGVLNKNGDVIIEPKFKDCEILADNTIIITDLDEVYLTNEKGIQISEKVKGERVNLRQYKENGTWVGKYFILVNKGKFGVLNKDFSIVLDCKYDANIDLINNDRFVTQLNGVNYILNNKNKIIKQFDFPFSFNSEVLLKNGKYNYIIRKDKTYGAKCGIMNENFEIILPIEYDWISFSNDVWVIRKGRSEYILDKNYNIIPNTKYKEIGKFELEGIACAKDDMLKLSFINSNGEPLSDFIFDGVCMGNRSTLDCMFESGLCGVMYNSKWGYVDTSGKLVIECKFDIITEFDNKGNAIVKFNGKWGVIDKQGKSIIPFVFENIANYNIENELIKSSFEDKFGVIDFNGNTIINFDYDNLVFNNNIIYGYSKKPVAKKAPKAKTLEPINLLDNKLIVKHKNLEHNDLIRVMVLAIVSGEEDELSNRLYIIDVVKKDLNTATFVSGYAGGGCWDECTFINEKEYSGEEGGFTVFDYIREDSQIKDLVGDYVCEIDDDLDEYQYKSLKHFVEVGKEDMKLLYSVWYNENIDYSSIVKNDKKRFKKLLKNTGGIWWKDWNFKF